MSLIKKKAKKVDFQSAVVLAYWLWGDYLKADGEYIGWLIGGWFGVAIVVSTFIFYFVLHLKATSLVLEFASVLIALSYHSVFIVVFSYIYTDSTICASGVVDVNCRLNPPWEPVYYSTITFTTLGYGDLLPRGEARAFAAVQALIGFIFMPVLLSSFVALIRDYAFKAKESNDG